VSAGGTGRRPRQSRTLKHRWEGRIAIKRIVHSLVLKLVLATVLLTALTLAGCGPDVYGRAGPITTSETVSTTSATTVADSPTSTALASPPTVTAASVQAIWPLPDGSNLDLSSEPQQLAALSAAYAVTTGASPLDSSVTPDLVLHLETTSGEVEVTPYADSTEQAVVTGTTEGANSATRYLASSPGLANLLEGYRARLRSTAGTTAAIAAAKNDTPQAASPYVYRTYPNYIQDVLEPSWQVRYSTLILWGTIVDVLPSRYNSPDGKPWKPDENVTLPIAYTVVLVQPQEVLKGSPVSIPVAFRWEGGAFGPGTDAGLQLAADTGLEPGDQVLVFGTDSHRYGPGGTYEPKGYWFTTDPSISVFKRSGAEFASQTGTVTLGQVRDLIK
jgi:hypothetical protein